MTIDEKIKSITTKTKKLIAEKDQLQSENEKLHEEIKKLRTTISQNQENVASLKIQLGKTQLALESKQANDPEESKQLRKKFDKYIDELDKCIEWLENT